jgi:cysteine sulfinate desulfinase/cysteine desulfurase-like protein
MEKIKIFEFDSSRGDAKFVDTATRTINEWIEKTDPIITRFSCATENDGWVIYNIFYVERIDPPKDQI